MSFFNKLFSTKKKISDKATADKKSVVGDPIEKSISKEVISQEINVSVQKKEDKIVLD
jgi:ATP-dependent protease ClpP protease subunit